MDEGFDLIAGERRLTAAREAGLKEVPAIVMEVTDQEALELALIENLQRENLNVIEEADGYRELATEFNLTQEEIAARVGKSRAAVANAMRLLSLPEEVRAMLADNRLSSGHAKVLLGLNREKDQLLMSRKVVEEGLSVRELERAVKRRKAAPKKPRVAKSDIPSNHVTYLSDQLHAHFGTSIRVNPCKTYANGKKGKGTIEIDFFSNEDLERILEIIGLSSDE
jgi:ParB family chromosome partitioning protein